MGNIPVLSGEEVVRVFESLGWHVARRRGSHIVMIKEGGIATLSVPDHKEVRHTPQFDSFRRINDRSVHCHHLTTLILHLRRNPIDYQ